jgi:hypothetical protein
MTEGTLTQLDTVAVSQLMVLDASSGQCASPEGRSAWLKSIRFISDITSPYLTATELAPVWAKIASSPCYRGVSSDDRMFADLYRAVAARDAPSVIRVGTALLEGTASKSTDELTYLTTAIALAQVRTGDLQAANSLLQRQWAQIDHNEPYGIVLGELMVFSSAPGVATAAHPAAPL